MPFDIGFNFRNTSGYVTDPAYGVPVLAETYPHTYTNVNGYSINAGWGNSVGTQNLASGNDPRIAGNNYVSNSGDVLFRVELSSGSAPGAGAYTVDLAIGDPNGGRVASFKVLDNGTVKIDGTNGGSGYSTAAGHFRDASLADVAATTTWTGTTAAVTFASTVAQLRAGYTASGGDYSLTAHFRLAAAASGITGASAVTLGALTETSAGTVAMAGAAAPTLGALTTASAGVVALRAAAAPTLGALTSASAGAVAISAAGAATLGALTAAAAGAGAIQGAVAIPLAALTMAAAATEPIVGSSASSLGALTVGAAGVVGTAPILGAAAITLGAVTVVDAPYPLAPLTSAAIGAILIRGLASPTFGGVTVAGAGLIAGAGPSVGAGADTLSLLTMAAAGVVTGSPATPTTSPEHHTRSFTRQRGNIQLGPSHRSGNIPLGPGRRRRRP